MKKATYALIALVLLGALLTGSIGCGGSEDLTKLATKRARLRVATTTSLYDTGLWTYLEPRFEKEYGIELDVISAGSGAAMTYGRNGDVDVLTVHSRADELKFIEDGYGEERVWFAYNYFLIVGPEDDPAGLKGLTAEDAFKKLAENPGSGKFVSRGDNSGTHSKEKAIWKLAGYGDYDALKESSIAAGWYIDAGQGMGATLTMASEKDAYTLTDEGTYLATKSGLELVPIVESGSVLLNVYTVIVCTKSAKKDKEAQWMVDFLTSEEVQEIINEYGKGDYGKSLFKACAGQEEPAS
ncbi:MAG: extracellular solute-binding protein [Dehalococcoidia bacterium]|nr:extracellular solute-binding protein [Dehalococcoidia bacterium]